MRSRRRTLLIVWRWSDRAAGARSGGPPRGGGTLASVEAVAVAVASAAVAAAGAARVLRFLIFRLLFDIAVLGHGLGLLVCSRWPLPGGS